MYIIRAKNDDDEFLVYSPYQIDNGYAILGGIFNEEINKVAKLEFTVLKNHPARQSLWKLKTLIYLYDDGELIFRGRIVEITQDFETSMRYTCESDLAFLNDVEVQFTGGGSGSSSVNFEDAFYAAVYGYNRQIGSYTDHAFSIGITNIFQPTDKILMLGEDAGIQTALDVFFNWFVNPYGGWLKIRHLNDNNFIDWVALPDVSEGSTPTNSQLISFESNIIDFEQYVDCSSVATVIYPYGAKRPTSGRYDISSLTTGHVEYIEDTNASELFGCRIVKIIIYDTLTEPAEILQCAERDLSLMILNSVSIDISAVDLSLIDVNASKLQLGQSNRVLSLPHGIDGNFILQRREINLSDPSKNRYIFGRKMKRLTDSMEYSKVITRG